MTRPKTRRRRKIRCTIAPPGAAIIHSDFDDCYERPLVLDGLTVFELDDLPPIVSPIIQPNGDRIIYYPIPERQPWIGFLKPSWVDEEEFEEEEEDEDAATE